jgi:hypothetical protein
MSVVASEPDLPRWSAVGRLAAAPWLWALLATLFLVVISFAGQGPSLSDWLGDTDDAVRLVTVRDLINGAPWFDTTLPRIGAPEPLVSHWSRLIDLPLAAMIGALSPLLGPDRAELVTRIIWPTLLFFALALIVAREAQRRAGPLAATFALVLVSTSVMALAQFRPGRIDHHNAQILCAVGGLLFLVRSLDDKPAGWIAGVLLGLGFAVGYEAIALTVPALGLASLTVMLQSPRHSKASEGVTRAAVAATSVLFVAFIATIPPTRWLDVRCDALSFNLVAFAVCGTAGLWAAMRIDGGHVARCAILGAGLFAGAGIYSGLEPACLAGPFGQVAPALKPIWLDEVIETKSVLWLAASHPAPALAAVAFVLAGAAAQVALWRRKRDASTALAAAFVILAALLGCWQIKLLPYASWLAAVPLGIWAAGLHGTASISPLLARVAAVMLLSQAALDAGFTALLSPMQRSGQQAASEVEASDPRRPCFLSHNVRRLAALPPGLVAGDIDLGPYIVALSPHRVVAAPYHRLEKGILANHAILSGKPEQALQHLEVLGVDYVALCADRWQSSNRSSRNKEGRPLRARLLDGDRFGFLQELEMPADAGLRVWKVAPIR